MIERSIKRQSLRALMVDDELVSPTAEGRAVRSLVHELKERSVDVVEATSAEDGLSVIVSDSAIHAILVDWTLGDDKSHKHAIELIKFVRSRNDKIPVFLMSERSEASSIPVSVMEMANALGTAGERDNGLTCEHVVQQLHGVTGTLWPWDDRHIGKGEITRQVRQCVRCDPDDRTRDSELLSQLFVFRFVNRGD